MTKYVVKLNLLIKKNQKYEQIFDEIKKKEASQSHFADILAMKDKLDFVEKEISFSEIFKKGKQNDDPLISLIAGKAEQLNNEDFDLNPKDALSHLQEILAAMYSIKGGAALLNILPKEHSDFKLEDWEKDFINKLKGAQFSTAKSVMNLVTNRDKFREVETQTELDPLKELVTKMREEHDKLTKEFALQNQTLEHTQKKLIQMRKSHDEERKRWAARDAAMSKVENEHKELEMKYRHSKTLELDIQLKLHQLTQEVEKREQNLKQMETDFKKQTEYFNSNDYIISQIQNCIAGTRNSKGGFGKSNPLYDAFMKLNIVEEDSKNSSGNVSKNTLNKNNFKEEKNLVGSGATSQNLAKDKKKGIYMLS